MDGNESGAARILTQDEWRQRALAVLPGGGFGNFDPACFVREGRGSRVWDENGKEYVDLLIGSGPMLLGHGHPEVLEAVARQLPRGMTFFANNALAIELAEAIVEAVPCAEQLRYVCTGGEADMYAMRLARAFTGREKILKFEGGYHGMCAEAQMSLAPERLANFPQAVPDSAGIPESVRAEVLVAPFNDEAFVRSLMAERGSEVAAIVVEPLQRIIPPKPGFLEALREEADKAGALLVFDEIVTGFRLAYGGAQEAYGVSPDIATLGKVIGGGFALAAIASSSEIMSRFDKEAAGSENWLMQLGTLSGNPVAAAAGLKTLEILRRPGQYDLLRENGRRLMAMAGKALDERGVAHEIVGDPTLFEVVFPRGENADKGDSVRDYRSSLDVDKVRAAAFNRTLMENGVFKSPGKTYPSLALDGADFDLMESAYNAAASLHG